MLERISYILTLKDAGGYFGCYGNKVQNKKDRI